MLEVVLGVSTVLGGIAALMYFQDRWTPDWLTRLKSSVRAPAIPVDPRALFAYASSHPRPLKLARAIAQRRGLEFRPVDSESVWLIEQIEVLGIKTIRELDQLVKQHATVALRLSDYMTPQQPIDTGFVLGRVLEVVAITRGGKEGLLRFCTSLRYSSGGSGWANEIFSAYQQVAKYG